MKLLPSIVALLLLPAATVAQTTRPAGVTVAVFDFEADGPAAGDLGRQSAEVVAALLGGEPGLRLVERAALDRVVDELELGASGLVGDRAAEAGRLVGAELIVVGRAFTMGDTAYLSVRVIGTETGLVRPVLAEADAGGRGGPPMADLAREAAAGVAAVVRDDSGDLLATPAIDPLPALIERAAAVVPDGASVRVAVPERHFGRAAGGVDPAAQTELASILRAAGFTVVDDPAADWTVEGEAFSETGTRLGDLVSCAARVELVVRRDGERVWTGRAIARAADLGEQTAGKLALERAARDAAAEVLGAMVDGGE